MENNLPIIALFMVPTIALVVGHYFFLLSTYQFFNIVSLVILFTGLSFLGYGFFRKRFRGKIREKFRKKERNRHLFLAIGWLIFAIYWAIQPEFLYWKGEEDIVNASFCIIGVYFLSYIAYHEWLSHSRGEKKSLNKSLDFLAGTAFISAFFYFIIEKTMMGGLLIKVVAEQTAWMMRSFGFDVVACGIKDLSFGGVYVPIKFNNVISVQLILACTGLQSMMIFIGAICSLNDVDASRRWKAFFATVPMIYLLNIFRNVGVIYGMEVMGFDFYLMHNVIGKFGSLIVLIILAFAVFHILPELYDDIVGLLNLPKRNGPVEKFFSNLKK